MKFRWHREILAESMETVTEFKSVRELKEYLGSVYPAPIEKVKITFGGFDERISWVFSHVLIKLKGDELFHSVGMIDRYKVDSFKILKEKYPRYDFEYLYTVDGIIVSDYKNPRHAIHISSDYEPIGSVIEEMKQFLEDEYFLEVYIAEDLDNCLIITE